MDIEYKLALAAPPDKVWNVLLDPVVMSHCIPGVQSVVVISPTEYKSVIKVKISFISAKFKLNTRILEQRENEYMRVEGTGEDKSVLSSFKQSSELFLTALSENQTELHMLVKVELLGRLGTFGLSVMRNKAQRIWAEFGEALVKQFEAEQPTEEPLEKDAA
jgi:carbon monoxide dehydrogenase subunit G